MSWRFPELVLLTVLAVAGCGRTPPPADPCADGHCPCVFDSDCPLEHTCVDNVCVRIEDYLECLTNGARPEECNGRDDDCDGMTDEGLGERACERSQGLLTCAGTEVCGGAAGWVCDAPLPGAELCDGIDNDCNGITDDPFVDVNGQYFGKQNCGGCGVSCDVIIPDAAETECALEAEGPHCRVVLCPAGTFPDETRSTCLTLPDPLCQPCQEDDDCRGPGARCLDLGNDERACGRDCGPGSAWGVTCPVGFFCQDAQCFPTSGTCLCGPTVIGATRSCVIDTCDGFETCESTQTGFEWGTCDISAHRETCDGLDNDCDGLIDNGFLNPNTGRYESDLHCGVCNNDCTRRWVPEVDHAVGGCEVASGRPECHILQCTTETLGAQVFEWVNVNGAEDDGCECRRRQGNTTVDPPDLGTFEQLAQGVIDENCDGVDGVVGDAFFVRPNAAAGGDGSLARPFRTVGAALAAFPGSGKVYILVAEGVYREEVVLFEGVQLYGGYSDDFLRRDVLQLATILQSPVAPGVGAQGTVRASGLGLGATRTILAGFHVYGADAAGSAAAGTEGATSVAIAAVNVGPNLVLQNNVVRGGRGGEGGRGSTGQTGFGRQQSTALDGQRGIDGRRVDGDCNGTFVAGGSGGVNGTCPASSSTRGGNTTCPTFDWNVSPIQGGQAEYTSVGSNGAGGFHRSFDQISGPGCSHVTESGFPTSIQTNNGGDGTDGADGAPGANGLGCRAAFGTVVGAVFAPWAANSGVGGTDGGGGGGGGAGGGTARFGNTFNDCPAHELGATGGGGGAGGCGGTGGAPGGSGGGSIGLLLVGPGVGPTLASNRFERGLGGRGGDGGFGGPGGRGGRGAFGGGPTSWSGADGGKGGDGGNGGDGGGGGGGCGGASYGVLAVRASGAGIATSNDFTVADNVSTGGPAGSGGNGTAGGRGANGGSSNVLVVSACGPGGTCAAGLFCDANLLCFPSGP